MELSDAIRLFIKNLQKKGRSIGTIKEYQKDLNMLNQYLVEHSNSQVLVQEVSIIDLDNYLKALIDKRIYSPASRNRQLNTIRSFYKYLATQEIVMCNLGTKLELLKVDYKERTYLTVFEVNQLLTAIDNRLIKLVVSTLFYTGLRISECLTLTVEDIDFKRNLLFVKNGKGNKQRRIPLNEALKLSLQEYVKEWRTEKSSPLLFQTERTGKLSGVYVNKVIKAAVKKLGWSKNVTCHVLRHSFASALIDKNVNLVAVKDLLGHADLKTTSVYSHIQVESLEDAIKMLKL